MSPLAVSSVVDFRLSPTGRQARRLAARAGVFGAVNPLTIFPDSVDVSWAGIALPTGVDHIDRLVFENTGGREGTPIYAHVLYPTVTAVGKAMIFLCGHWSGGWNTYYTLNMETSIPLRMLARGWVVIMVDMPNYGLQPTQATWYQGSVHTMDKNTFHWPNGGILDDGYGNTLRLFYDHCFGITNWGNAPIVAGHPEQGGGLGEVVCLAGQSGGAAMAGQYAAMEDRIRIWHIMQSGNPVAQSFSTVDAEQMTSSTIEIALGVSMLLDGDSIPFYAGVPGRILVMHAADADEYTGDKHVQWEDFIPRWASLLAPASSLSFNRKTTGTHSIDATQAAFVENHLVAYGMLADPSTMPGVPAGLGDADIEETSFTLSWSAATNATGYEVFQAGTSIGTPTGTSLSVTGLTAETAYSMTVRSRNAAGVWSAQSPARVVTTAEAATTMLPSVRIYDESWAGDYLSRNTTDLNGLLFVVWFRMTSPGNAPWSQGNKDVLEVTAANWVLRCITANGEVVLQTGADPDLRYNQNSMLYCRKPSNNDQPYITDYTNFLQTNITVPAEDWITHEQFVGWTAVAWQIVGHATNGFTFRQYLKFGTTGALKKTAETILDMTALRAELQAQGWSLSDRNAYTIDPAITSIGIGGGGGDIPSNVTKAKVYAVDATEMSLAAIDAIILRNTPDTSAYADWPLTWNTAGGVPDLSDQSGNNRPLSIAGGEVFEGPDGPF